MPFHPQPQQQPMSPIVPNARKLTTTTAKAAQDSRNTFTTLSSFTRLKDKIQFHYLPDEIKDSITQKKKTEEYKALLASSNPTQFMV